jgi:hypothetical protein
MYKILSFTDKDNFIPSRRDKDYSRILCHLEVRKRRMG